MSRQKILRVKATFEVPFANVREGADAYGRFKDMMEPGAVAKAYAIEGLDVKWTDIEETTRTAPEPAPKEAERVALKAAE